MVKSYISLKYEEFKEKFKSFFLHRKKIKALENYALCEDFEGSKYIKYLKELLVDGFLDDEEERFLDHQINKIEIDALSWAHKTRWLKGQLQARRSIKMRKVDPQIYFDFDRIREPLNPVPVHLLKNMQNQHTARI